MAEAEAKVKFSDKEFEMDTGVVSFAFGNGTVLEIDSNELSADMQKRLMLHGISQKVGDSYAGAKGNYATAIESAQGVIDQLKQGIWRAARGEGEARPRLGELADAIARIKGVDRDKAMAAVEKATDEQRKAWRSNARVKSEIAAIRAEAAAAALAQAGEQELVVNIE